MPTMKRFFFGFLASFWLVHATAFGQGLGATPASSFRVPEGFAVDLVYEVPIETQGSWVAMCNDLRGGLIVSDQYGQLYRVRPGKPGEESKTTVEPIEVNLGMAQGLLHTKDGLYVDVNGIGILKKKEPAPEPAADPAKEAGSEPAKEPAAQEEKPESKPAEPEEPSGPGLYRLQDLDGDDRFEKVERILPLVGGGEHGPHAIIPGPDGRLYLCAGNQTDLPEKIDRSRVPRHWSEDHMLGRMPDARGFMADRLAPGGFILSFKPDGSDVELVATGFRNEYDIAFNPLGDLFTYDADMEWDIGTPWYRPTRVNHVISGAEFGWRNGTGKWPEYFADSFGAVANIGYGSPTGIAFGTGTRFPAKYQNALLIGDWSYGVVYAVHMEPDGATYQSKFEPFISASPMPVTDMVVDPAEGCLYMTIGGRKTQSALYRIRYTGKESTAPARFPDNPAAAQARAARRALEAMHVPGAKLNLDLIMKHLGSPDRALRTAARLALEHFDSNLWRDPIAQSLSAQATITLAIALARKGTPADQADIQNALLRLQWAKLSNTEKLELLRAYQLSFLRLGEGSPEIRDRIVSQLDPHFPTSEGNALVDRELARVLIYLKAPRIVERCVAEMNGSNSADQQIHYAFCLRDVQEGWTEATRKAYFQWFYEVATARGGASFGGFLENIRKVAMGWLSDEEKVQLGELVGNPPAPKDPLADLAPRALVKQWTVEELAAAATAPNSGSRNFERGKQLFAVAQCYKCHRFAGQGGIQGPDLTASSQRFSTRDMLTAIIEPNKEISDQYEATIFQTEEQTVIGRVANLNGNILMVATNMLDPGNFTNLDRREITDMKPSKASMMPSGLLDTLSSDEVLDLLAYLKSGGNPKSDVYSSR